MTSIPEINIQNTPVYDMMNGHAKSYLLLSAIELNLFDCLSSPSSSRKVAEQLETHPENTALILDGLVAAGLIHKENGLYQNTPDTQHCLTRQSPAYVGEMILIHHQITNSAITDMCKWVRQGPPASEPDLGAADLWSRFARTMANYQLGGCVQKMTRFMSARPEFSSMKKMLDLGGGHGLFCIAMIEAHPSMTGVIFDQPPVVRMAQEFITSYGFENRISTIGGDYTQDELGSGYDLVWASATLTFVRGNLDPLFKTVYQSMNPGGLFVSLAEGVTHERTRPAGFIIQNLAYSLVGQDRMFDRGEISTAMSKAGFTHVLSTPADSPMMSLEIDIARKPD